MPPTVPPQTPSSPVGLHRVLDPVGVLPQAAHRLDARPQLWPDEVRVGLELLNLDAASYRQLARVVRQQRSAGRVPTVAVVGGAGKSGSLSLAAARDAGAARTVGVVPVARERELLEGAGLADVVAVADARDPVALADAVTGA